MKKYLNFIMLRPSVVPLTIINIIILIAVIDLGSIALLSEAVIFCQNLQIPDIHSFFGRMVSGLLSFTFTVLTLVLDFCALRYYKNPQDYEFKDEQ